MDDRLVHTAFRFPKRWLARIDSLVPYVAHLTNSRGTRSSVVRYALGKGLAALEAEASYHATNPAVPGA